MNQAQDTTQSRVVAIHASRHAPPNQSSTTDRDQQARFAAEVLQAEAQAIQNIQITPAFHDAVELILRATSGLEAVAPSASAPSPAPPPSTGSVVVSGLGKSGLIGQKISATLASTGTPSHFLHPTEAMHGDLGRVRRGDVVLLLSFGGSTEEVVGLATILKQDRVPVIAIVGTLQCDLARLATVTLPIGDIAEACPLNLAPTASTTAMLALGDALAMCVAHGRSFGVEDFRKVHPGGSLGRQLMPVVDAMRFHVNQNLPLIDQNATVSQAIAAEPPNKGSRRSGAMLVIDDAGKLAGILTDADLRRLLADRGSGALSLPIQDAMTANPRCLNDQHVVRDAVQMVREHRIDEIPVVDAEGKPLGLIDIQDLLALKVIQE